MRSVRRVVTRVPFFVEKIAGARGSLKWGVYERIAGSGSKDSEGSEGSGLHLIASWRKRSEAREAARQLNKEERESVAG